ncbi:MAG: alpha/beta hydrolase [Planctomycetes bacterium]|nr:alpha/beta hydrolase [Planctomycetota bacterium]
MLGTPRAARSREWKSTPCRPRLLGPVRAIAVWLAWHAIGWAAAAGEPERIPLWNGRAPIGDGRFESAEAWLTIHVPDKPRGDAVVICPGGAYTGLVVDSEGHGIAEWLGRHGVVGAVLEYRLPAGRHRVPLLDAQRAVRHLRARAAAIGIKTDRIGVIGFSAGGHLASTLGTHFDAGDPAASDPIDRMSCRPDFMILIYPVITMGAGGHSGSREALLGGNRSAELIGEYSNETRVTAESATPPTFLAHALDDTVVPPDNSRAFHEAMRRSGKESELLLLPSGGHGLNGYQGPMWDAWRQRVLEWLRPAG